MNAHTLASFRGEGVCVRFGQFSALDNVDFEVRQGEIVGLIGPNGAGKTTLTNVLTGFQGPTEGRVMVGKQVVNGWSPDRLARHGISRTFQAVRPFRGLTVTENVEAAAAGVGLKTAERRELVGQLLSYMGLEARANSLARDLPHGEERRLGVARALGTRPTFLLLDEPAAGLNEHESEQLVDDLAGIRDEFGCGLMIIEHDMRVIMQLCERIQVLDHGKTIATGTPVEIQRDPAVITAYLGTSAGVAAC